MHHWPSVKNDVSLLPIPPEYEDLLRKREHLLGTVNSLCEGYTKLTASWNGGKEDATGYLFAMAFFKVFQQTDGQIYQIAEDFGHALLKAETKVLLKYLKFDETIRCLEFPKSLAFDMGDGDSCTCVYVGLFGGTFENRPCKVIEIVCPLVLADGTKRGHDNIRLVITSDGAILDATVNDTFEVLASKGRITGISREMVAFIIKCLLYLHSGDPDLRHLRPEPKPRNAKALKKWRRTNVEHPVILVGFDYKKPKAYSAGEVFVDTHLRWQPYGPGYSQVKLIWVKEHTRHYGDGPN